MWKSSGILLSYDWAMDDLYSPEHTECHIIIRCRTTSEVEGLRNRLLECLNNGEVTCS